jgi:hypothetical protein
MEHIKRLYKNCLMLQQLAKKRRNDHVAFYILDNFSKSSLNMFINLNICLYIYKYTTAMGNKILRPNEM